MDLLIITATLNAAATIANLLSSIKNQTDSCEHIVVDGGSKDATLDIVKEYGISQIVQVPDSTIYEALNIGIDYCKSGYCWFLGADDSIYSITTVSNIKANTHPLLHYRIKMIGCIPTYSKRNESYVYDKTIFTSFGKFEIDNSLAEIKFIKKLPIKEQKHNDIIANVSQYGKSSELIYAYS